MSGITYHGAYMRAGYALVTRNQQHGDKGLMEALPNPMPDPGGFRWGDRSPGTIDLSVALLFDVCGDFQTADFFALDFAEEVVSEFPTNGFIIAEGTVKAWLTHALDTTTFRIVDLNEEGVHG